MKHLIDKEKFLEELHKESKLSNLSNQDVWIETILSKHLENIIDEPHHPSGKDRDKINTRNDLRREMRNDSF